MGRTFSTTHPGISHDVHLLLPFDAKMGVYFSTIHRRIFYAERSICPALTTKLRNLNELKTEVALIYAERSICPALITKLVIILLPFDAKMGVALIYAERSICPALTTKLCNYTTTLRNFEDIRFCRLA